MRRALDLEHWAAFSDSFERMVELLRDVGAGERGTPAGDGRGARPETCTTPTWPRSRSGEGRMSRAPSTRPSARRSGTRSTAHERSVVRAAARADRARVVRARSRVPPASPRPEIRWRLAQSPDLRQPVRHARARRPLGACCGSRRSCPATGASRGSRRRWSASSRKRTEPRGPTTVAEANQAAEDADVRGAVGADRDRREVVVEAEAGAGQLLVDRLAGAEVDRGEVPGIGPAAAVAGLRVRVDQPARPATASARPRARAPVGCARRCGSAARRHVHALEARRRGDSVHRPRSGPCSRSCSRPRASGRCRSATGRSSSRPRGRPAARRRPGPRSPAAARR